MPYARRSIYPNDLKSYNWISRGAKVHNKFTYEETTASNNSPLREAMERRVSALERWYQKLCRWVSLHKQSHRRRFLPHWDFCPKLKCRYGRLVQGWNFNERSSRTAQIQLRGQILSRRRNLLPNPLAPQFIPKYPADTPVHPTIFSSLSPHSRHSTPPTTTMTVRRFPSWKLEF